MKAKTSTPTVEKLDAETRKVMKAAELASKEGVQSSLEAGLVVTIIKNDQLIQFDKTGILSSTQVDYPTSRKLTPAEVKKLQQKFNGRLRFFPNEM